MIPNRILFATLALLAGLASPALAQPQAAQAPAAPDATAAQPTSPTPARPRLVRRTRGIEDLPRAEAIPLLPTAQASVLGAAPRGDRAPVPNRDIELPSHKGYSMQARLMPEVFHRSMPGRGMTAEGVSSQREERVYAPAPGARLTVPFFTR